MKLRSTPAGPGPFGLHFIACALIAWAFVRAAAYGQPVAFVQVAAEDGRTAGFLVERTILAGRYLQDSRLMLADFPALDAARPVTDGFASVADPAFAHDGSLLFFAGARKAGDPLGLWELAVHSQTLRAFVSLDADCVSPVPLPDGRVVFASTAAREYEEHGERLAWSLYARGPGDEAPTRLTFNPSSDFDPVVLADGRILYSSWQHVGNHFWPRGNVALLLINSDGTGLFPLTGNHRGPRLKRGATPWKEDKIIFIQADAFESFGAGAMVMTSLNDAFAPYENLLPADQYLVSDAAALADGRVLISARPVGDVDATFGLYVYEDHAVHRVFDDPAFHEVMPAVGGPRAAPDVRVSTVVDGTPFGYVAVLNCYETDRTDQHPTRPDAIRSVRVIEGRPLRRDGDRDPVFVSLDGRREEPMLRAGSATSMIPQRILGEVPPASDGSLYLKVPADRPLRLQLIDSDGFSVINERAWFWVRPNERRVCIGCHENRELAPPNKVPRAVRREPTDLTDPARWRTVSFRRDVAPILRTTCAVSPCHVPPSPTAGLNLSLGEFNSDRDAVGADLYAPAYANLLARQDNKPFRVGGRLVHPGDARSSPLMWMLYGRALAAQYEPAPFDRPMISAHPGPMLPEDQLELLRTWIDLGAPYADEGPAAPWPPRPVNGDQLAVEEQVDAR